MHNLSRLSVFILMGLLALSCKKDKPSTDDNQFDRTAILTDYAEHTIKPSFLTLQANVNDLKIATEIFVNQVDETNLTSLQTEWRKTYLSWQYANGFNFGPAGEEGTRKGLNEEIGIFPISETKINGFITDNNANFNDFNRDARGFLAVEFLIFNLGGNNAVILTQMGTENRRNYLTNLINHIKSNVDRVADVWNGPYLNEFTSNNGTAIGSSTSALYNEFVKCFEATKNLKLGLPLGLRPGQIETEPERLEAYYSGASLAMLTENIQALKNTWNGIDRSGTQRIGFKTYLESVSGGNELVQSTIEQLAIIDQTLANVPQNPSLSQQIINSTSVLNTLHTELQKHTRFFKSDMSSLLGISITYISGDGD